MIQNRTSHAILSWLSPADIARRLGCSRWTAMRKIKAHREEMGAELLYPFDNRDGGRWRVSAEKFAEWLRARGIVS